MERRNITPGERDALHRFLKLDLSFDNLLIDVHGMIEIDILSAERRFTSHFYLVEPPLRVAKSDIELAIQEGQSGRLSERDLVRWATMLLLNDAYVWEGEDEDEIADALNDLSFGGLELYERNRA
ncbi:MAG TPA: hypothetical protein VFW25_12160 [Silvibacterium sp.]|nr:hypothetical protein [Silvibacterium sp.]